jgi:hypothetical protein
MSQRNQYRIGILCVNARVIGLRRNLKLGGLKRYSDIFLPKAITNECFL